MINKLTTQEKKMLLKQVLDDITFNALNTPKKIEDSFIFNVANIIIATKGVF
jgi:hypothetical protein